MVMVTLATPWDNPNLALFHGTVDRYVESIQRGIDLRWARKGTDFGRGFYLTTSEGQARDWAISRAEDLGGKPAVLRFDVSRDAISELDTLWFVRADSTAIDYWRFVRHCRRGRDHVRRSSNDRYDMVVGPVAVGWRRKLETLPHSDQAGFHTARATTLLDASRPEMLPW